MFIGPLPLRADLVTTRCIGYHFCAQRFGRAFAHPHLLCLLNLFSVLVQGGHFSRCLRR